MVVKFLRLDYDELSVDELFETTCFGFFFTNIVRTGIKYRKFLKKYQSETALRF